MAKKDKGKITALLKQAKAAVSDPLGIPEQKALRCCELLIDAAACQAGVDLPELQHPFPVECDEQ